jgi:hypothetical protein
MKGSVAKQETISKSGFLATNARKREGYLYFLMILPLLLLVFLLKLKKPPPLAVVMY